MKIDTKKLKNAALIGLSAILLYSIFTIRSYNTVIRAGEDLRRYLVERNDSLYSKYLDLQKEYDAKNGSYIKLDSILDNRNKQLERLKLEKRDLQSKLTNLENEMANITPDSSYSYLMHRYIPIQDSLKYGFAPNQIKLIHRDVISMDVIQAINSNLELTNKSLIDAYNTSNIKFNTCKDQTSILLEQQVILNSRISNLNSINNTYKKEIRKQKVKSILFGAGATGLITYIVVSSIINSN